MKEIFNVVIKNREEIEMLKKLVTVGMGNFRTDLDQIKLREEVDI